MYLLIDNYDSFTYNLYHYFLELGEKIEVCRNDKITPQEVLKKNYKGIVLSPGPCTPNEAGICLDLISKSKSLFPILGICLGHQSIGQAFGGKIVQCEEIMHGKIDKISHNNHPIFNKINNEFTATRYHSLAVDDKTLPDEFIISARSLDDNEIMGLRHKKYQIQGIQCHPESILTKHGKKILQNFVDE